MTSPVNVRSRTRNRLYLWGAVPSLVLLVFALKVVVMLTAQSAGESAYGSERYDDARAEFVDNRRWNLIESWRAPFNEGDALFRLEEHQKAVEAFETALSDAPEDRSCMIRVNIALSHEALGDASLDTDDAPGAIESWRTGREVLAEGSCDTDDARTVDERLEEKLEQQEQQERPGKKQKPTQEPDKPDPELERKRQEVQEKNQRGRDQRKDYQQLDDYPYQPDQPEQHW